MSNNLKKLNKIKEFVNALFDVYGDTFHEIKLYHYLISRTTCKNRKSMKKHFKVFKVFCEKNKRNILNQQSELKFPKIIYSDRVFIDINKVLKESDRETSKAIWEHLLCITALLSPEHGNTAINILKKSLKEKTPENDFLSDMMGQVGSHIQGNGAPGNPMQMIGSIMQSGLLKNVMSGMSNGVNSGNLDIKKLLGSVQGMISNISENLPENVNTLDPNVELDKKTEEKLMSGVKDLMSTIVPKGKVDSVMSDLTNISSMMKESSDTKDSEDVDYNKDSDNNKDNIPEVQQTSESTDKKDNPSENANEDEIEDIN